MNKNEPILMIKLLLNRKIDINCRDINNCTPLHFSFFNMLKTEYLMYFLIDNKADVNAKDLDLYSPIHYAINYL